MADNLQPSGPRTEPIANIPTPHDEKPGSEAGSGARDHRPAHLEDANRRADLARTSEVALRLSAERGDDLGVVQEVGQLPRKFLDSH